MPEAPWLSRTLLVTTPEAVDFAYELAGAGHRLLAWLVDGAILMAATVLTSLLFSLAGDLGAAVFFTLSFGLMTFYFIVFETVWHGQSPGKRVAGIRVLDERGFRVTFSQAAVRNLLRLFDSLPFLYLVGGVAMLLNRRGLRLGDLAAGTVVVRLPHVPPPSRLLPEGDRSGAFLGDFALAERVRRTLRSDEKDLLASLAVRRERLEDRARMHVFESAAAAFERLLGLPKPATMSPETYVLNLAAVAHAPRETPSRAPKAAR
jgi:uncharacterized RDD family membrane protein YckC